jgi:hypothetical protein
MRKTPPKLALRKETLRALSDLQLAHVAAGQETDAPLIDVTRGNVCNAQDSAKNA